VAALVDTNVLVYKHDPRFPTKQRRAAKLLREGLRAGSVRLAHQVLLEFVAVVSRVLPDGLPLLAPAETRREVEELLVEFPILYPNDGVVRMALRGAAAYDLSWFDAHLWAYAEFYGLTELYSEDFQHGRLYGTVRVVNPFLEK
jgi:predicted nucleic acid-binding protein